jgi:hypothetical protein
MDFAEEYKTPDVPPMPRVQLSDELGSVAASFGNNLSRLRSATKTFVASVSLLYFCKGQPRNTPLLTEWSFIAARSGGMALRNWIQLLDAARSLAGRIPAWMPHIDVRAMKKASNTFDKQFPNIDKLRHAIAHPEFYANPEKDMVSKEPLEIRGASIGGGGRMSDMLINYTFVSSIEGIAAKYDATTENALFLIDLTKRVFSAIKQPG